MSDFGLSDEGFNRKRQDLLLEEMNAAMKAVFGDNLNVSPEAVDGQVNGVISSSNADLWEISEEAYNAFNPSAATGVTLSNLVQLNGITRNAASSSSVNVDLIGTAGTLIPAGSLISTSDAGDLFSTDIDVTLNGLGEATVFTSSIETGPILAVAGTLTVIETPITGWDTVNNPLDALEGENEETDIELRARRSLSVGRDSQAIIDSVFAEVLNLPNVTQVAVLENDTNSVDVQGLPPHSFSTVVVGGADADIADAIWIKKPAGITTFGNQTTQIIDDQGLPRDINWSRADEIPIFVIVNITTGDGYPINGDSLMKEAIVSYANGTLVAGRGFFLSDDVIYTRLYTPINSIPGHEIDDLFIDITAVPTGEINIPIALDAISVFTVDNIEVNS